MRRISKVFILICIVLTQSVAGSCDIQTGDLTPESIYWILQKEIPYPIVNVPDQFLRDIDPQAVKWLIKFPPITQLGRDKIAMEFKMIQRMLPTLERLSQECERQYKSYNSLTDFNMRSNSSMNTMYSSNKAIIASKARSMVEGLIFSMKERLYILNKNSSLRAYDESSEKSYQAENYSRTKTMDPGALKGIWSCRYREAMNNYEITACFLSNIVRVDFYMNSVRVMREIGNFDLMSDGSIKIIYNNGNEPDGKFRLINENTIQYSPNQHKVTLKLNRE